MKIFNFLLLQAMASAELLRPRSPTVSARDDDARVGLYFGTVRETYTPAVAAIIANITGVLATNVDHTDLNFNFGQFDSVIVGSPTYCTGCVDHRSETGWDAWMYDFLPTIDIRGKKIAIFGTGKQSYMKSPDADHWSGYPENFGDALGEIYDRLAEAGATLHGFTPENHDPSTGGYNFTHSKFIRNGMFMGKMFDQRVQPELSEGRAQEWIQQLRDEGFFSKSTKKGARGEVNAVASK